MKKDSDVTAWFTGNEKPSREGVYERDISTSANPTPVYSYWNGNAWCMWAFTIPQAHQYVAQESRYQNLAWRGLASKP